MGKDDSRYLSWRKTGTNSHYGERRRLVAVYCIYKVTNKINNKVYIGKTKDFERRKKEHLAHKTNHLFSRALHKYGEDSFLWEIIEADINTVEEASDREKFWIKNTGLISDGMGPTVTT